MKKEISRRNALEALARTSIGFVAASALPDTALAAPPVATDRQIAEFKSKLPSALRPFIALHGETSLGRADIDAMARCVVEVKTANPSYFMYVTQGGEKMTESALHIAPEIAQLDPKEKRDRAIFSALLSNEAAHVVQHEHNMIADRMRWAKADVEEGCQRYLEIEMASDARMFVQIAQMIDGGIIQNDNVKDIFTHPLADISVDTGQFESAFVATRSAGFAAGKGVEDAWGEHPDGDRLGQYIRNALSQSIIMSLTHDDFLLDGLLLQSDPPSPSKWGVKLDRSAGVSGFHAQAGRLSARVFREAKTNMPFVRDTLTQFYKVGQGKVSSRDMIKRLKSEM